MRPRLGAGVRRQHDRVVASRELQIVVVQPGEGLTVLDVHETAHILLDLLGDLVGKNAFGVEIGGRAEIHAELVGGAGEDAAIEDDRHVPDSGVAADGATEREAVLLGILTSETTASTGSLSRMPSATTPTHVRRR